MTCINFDGMFPSDLDKHAVNPALHSMQRKYAEVKAKAMRAREAGKIPVATSLERRCENLYQSMPKALRW